MPCRRQLFAPLALVALLALSRGGAASPAGATAWAVDPDASSFVVLTHRAGAAARLAHDHVVVARRPKVTVEFDPRTPERARVDFVEPVLALEIDDPADRTALEPRLRALGILREPLGPTDDEERAKVRAAMLEPHQLFAERFPEIRAELSGVVPAASGGSGEARLSLEIRGERVAKQVPVTWRIDGEALDGELVAAFRFTEFGIEPYSSYLGLVRNDDLFHLVAHLVARRAAP